MTAPETLSIVSNDDAFTEAIGASLAQTVPPAAPQALSVHLCGDLGAGKTTLVRGFMRALGATGAVRSPTYGLMERYELPPWGVLHLDLYRLRDPTEVLALGLRDHDQPKTIWMIEWPERGGVQLPAPDLQIELEAQQPTHRISLHARSPQGLAWLTALKLIRPS
jgi:tRNA threonylcarbamoyladenosine biosynthesis protein TsaE